MHILLKVPATIIGGVVAIAFIAANSDDRTQSSQAAPASEAPAAASDDRTPSSQAAPASEAPAAAVLTAKGCDGIYQHYRSHYQMQMDAEDRQSMGSAAIRNGTRGVHAVDAEFWQLEANIKQYKAWREEDAKEYVSHPECTEEADFMSKIVNHVYGYQINN